LFLRTVGRSSGNGHIMSFAEQLETTWPARFVADHPWSFPALEITHLLGLTVVFGGMVLLDLRLLGMGRVLPISLLQRHILPCVWLGFAVAAASGIWLILYEATKLMTDPAFVIKMILLPLVALNAWFMHHYAQRELASWDVHAVSPPWVRLSAVLSLLMWCVILACGRLIAYYYALEF
jgi:hypothetical protein